MFAKTCPWCEKKLSWPIQLGLRPPAIPPKCYQFTRPIAVCPFCNNAVKPSRKGQAWILLAVPALLMPIGAAIFNWRLAIFSPLFGGFLLLAITGVVLHKHFSHLEKSNDI